MNKYQIFISSTYEDLKEERERAIQAVLEMGHIPVGMEMFSAGDSEQWKLIQRQIDDCDYYIVIVAHKYGSMDNGISYTEKEYDYAVSKSIPVLGFIISEKAKFTKDQIEEDADKVKKLKAFKGKVKTKIVNFWSNKDELKTQISISLGKTFFEIPRMGWIKADGAITPDLTKELSRLSSENSQLNEKVKELNQVVANYDTSNEEKIIETLKKHTVRFGFMYQNSMTYEDKNDFDFYKIFNIIASELMVQKQTKYELRKYLAFMLSPKHGKDDTMAGNKFNSILTDLQVLKLIKLSSTEVGIAENKVIIELTDIGNQTYSVLRKKIMNEKNQK